MTGSAVAALGLPLYQPVEAAGLEGLAAQQPCAERLELMRPFLKRAKLVLDVGCHTGWFCRALKRLHIGTIGIDRSPEWLAAARELDPRGDYRLGDVAAMTLPHADAALCLSAVMYFGGECWPVLRKIADAAPSMFLDFGGDRAGLVPFDEASAVEAVLAETSYTSGELLGRSALDRPLFLFRRGLPR